MDKNTTDKQAAEYAKNREKTQELLHEDKVSRELREMGKELYRLCRERRAATKAREESLQYLKGFTDLVDTYPEMDKAFHKHLNRVVDSSAAMVPKEGPEEQEGPTWGTAMTPEDARVLDLADFMADVFEDREEYFAVISKALTAYHHLIPSEGAPEGEGRMVLDLIDAIEIAECL